jgi:hypothetical protein
MVSYRAVGIVLAAAACGAVAAAAATQGAASPQGNTWQSIAELPDWSGLWEPSFGQGRNDKPPVFTPAYRAKLAAYRAARKAGKIQDTPAANCVPPGLPGIMWQPYPIEFLFTPGKVTILIEAYSQWRQIFTDGRPLPKDPDLTFNGHSVGHWDGGTLLVDSAGFTQATPLGENYGMRHSAKMRIHERMHETKDGNLQIETTVEDPVALEKPWTVERTYGHHPKWTLDEYICEQNNRNFTTSQGKAGIDLNFKEGQQ